MAASHLRRGRLFASPASPSVGSTDEGRRNGYAAWRLWRSGKQYQWPGMFMPGIFMLALKSSATRRVRPRLASNRSSRTCKGTRVTGRLEDSGIKKSVPRLCCFASCPLDDGRWAKCGLARDEHAPTKVTWARKRAAGGVTPGDAIACEHFRSGQRELADAFILAAPLASWRVPRRTLIPVDVTRTDRKVRFGPRKGAVLWRPSGK